MKKILAGQAILILCCAVYLVWWYRGYRPGMSVNRLGGLNGVLLRITVGLGIAGLVLSLWRIEAIRAFVLSPGLIAAAGIAAYFALLLLTRYAFGRIVTTELLLIVGWTTLETSVLSRLYAAEALSGRGFAFLCAVIGAAFVLSMVLYVAYYRMEAMKAFYAAMIPLLTEAAAMAVLCGTVVLHG